MAIPHFFIYLSVSYCLLIFVILIEKSQVMGACHSEKVSQQSSQTPRSKKCKVSTRSPSIKSKPISESEIKSTVVDCFNRFDKNHDGQLDISDVMDLIKYSQDRHQQNHQ